MFDASALDYEANVAATAEAGRAGVTTAGVWVEAELGEIGGKDGVHAPGARTDPDEAAGVRRRDRRRRARRRGRQLARDADQGRRAGPRPDRGRSGAAVAACRWCCTARPACPTTALGRGGRGRA